MAGPPSRCQHCGFAFQTGLIEIGPDVHGITFENVSVTCPQCGGNANVGDGTYSSVGDTLRLLVGPSDTQSLLSELQDIAERGKTENLTSVEILREIAGVSPEFAQRLEQGRSWPAVGLILLLFWLVRSVSLDIRIDFNWLVDQAWHIGHGEDPEKHLTSPAPPEFPYDSGHVPPRFPNENLILATAAIPNRKARRIKKANERKTRKH